VIRLDAREERVAVRARAVERLEIIDREEDREPARVASAHGPALVGASSALFLRAELGKNGVKHGRRDALVLDADIDELHERRARREEVAALDGDLTRGHKAVQVPPVDGQETEQRLTCEGRLGIHLRSHVVGVRRGRVHKVRGCAKSARARRAEGAGLTSRHVEHDPVLRHTVFERLQEEEALSTPGGPSCATTQKSAPVLERQRQSILITARVCMLDLSAAARSMSVVVTVTSRTTEQGLESIRNCSCGFSERYEHTESLVYLQKHASGQTETTEGVVLGRGELHGPGDIQRVLHGVSVDSRPKSLRKTHAPGQILAG
jgi:hypothetical protein